MNKDNSNQTLIEIDNLDILQSLVGPEDSNLKTLCSQLDIQVARDSRGLLLKGQETEIELAKDLLIQLRGLLAQGEQLFPGDFERAVKMLAANRKLKLADFFRDQVRISGRKHTIVPKTENQRTYLEAIRSSELVFGVGPAGTGKTYLAMAMAVSALLRKEVKRIIISRPAVEAGERLGFLPGDMAEKVNPYLRPLYDALYDLVDMEKATELLEKGRIEVAPLAFMRGRTLSDAFIVLDEAQNTTAAQMKMFLTRMGFGSRCVVTGDITQVDLPRGVTSGLVQAINILDDVKGIQIIKFLSEDVVRHELVSRIVRAYDLKENLG